MHQGVHSSFCCCFLYRNIWVLQLPFFFFFGKFVKLFSFFITFGQCYMHILHVCFQSLSGCFIPICYFSSRSSSVYSTEALSFASLLKENSYWVLILTITASVTPKFTVCLCSLAMNASLSPMGRTVHFFFSLEKNDMTWEALFCSNFHTLKTIAEDFLHSFAPLGVLWGD